MGQYVTLPNGRTVYKADDGKHYASYNDAAAQARSSVAPSPRSYRPTGGRSGPRPGSRQADPVARMAGGVLNALRRPPVPGALPAGYAASEAQAAAAAQGWQDSRKAMGAAPAQAAPAQARRQGRPRPAAAPAPVAGGAPAARTAANRVPDYRDERGNLYDGNSGRMIAPAPAAPAVAGVAAPASPAPAPSPAQAYANQRIANRAAEVAQNTDTNTPRTAAVPTPEGTPDQPRWAPSASRPGLPPTPAAAPAQTPEIPSFEAAEAESRQFAQMEPRQTGPLNPEGHDWRGQPSASIPAAKVNLPAGEGASPAFPSLEQMEQERRAAFMGAADSVGGINAARAVVGRYAGVGEADLNRYSMRELEQLAQGRIGATETRAAFSGDAQSNPITAAPQELYANRAGMPEVGAPAFAAAGAAENAEFPVVDPSRGFQDFSRSIGRKAAAEGWYQTPVNPVQQPLVMGVKAEPGLPPIDTEELLSTYAALGEPVPLTPQESAAMGMGAANLWNERLGGQKLARLGFRSQLPQLSQVAASAPSFAGAPGVAPTGWVF